MAQQEQDFAHESIPRLLIKLSVPAIFAQLINALYNIVDRMYIGHIPDIGPTALTGVGITFPIILLISAFASLVGMGGAPLVSIEMGRADTRRAEKIMSNSFAMLLAIAVLLTAFFLGFRDPLLRAFGASEATLPYARDYITIYVIGTIAVQIALGLNSFITAQGFAKTSMATVAIGAVINIVLDPIFIFVFHMDVRGAALATILSQAVSAVWVLQFLTGHRTVLHLRLSLMKPELRLCGKVLALGAAPFIMQSTESLIQVVFNTSLSRYGGDMYVGAMTVMSSIMQVFFMPINGVTQGAQPIIGYNFGAGHPARVRTAVKWSFGFCMFFAVAIWLLTMFAPDVLTSIFTNSAELKAVTGRAMKIYFATTFMMGAQMSFQNAFLSLGKSPYAVCLALLRKVILLVPLVYILPNFISPGYVAVLTAEPIADFLAAVTTSTIFLWRIGKILGDRKEKKEKKR